MEKILIATKNKDKFEIVKRILDSIHGKDYEYYNLYDIKDLYKNDKESGTVQERAYNKAKEIFLNIKNNDFKYIIGIDDGIKMKGIIRENVKDYIEDIINNKYLKEGEQVEIVRSYCFMSQDGNNNIVTTQIPFIYHKLNNRIEIKENSYPLSNVLIPLNSCKTVAEMNKEENNLYYLKYSEQEIKEVFK